ncbi:PH domain-containing protein [uncultured Methylobacterium sp.]|uniref:PH domain-containing protein n=1 Tax=uncultured Methylobacterium sp. TaxID=157278 RepID=UPI0035CB4F28
MRHPEGTLPDQIATRLLRDEAVAWWGRPVQGLRLTARDGFLIPFSCLWGGFAIFWEVSVLRGAGPSFFALFGIPFVLIGLFLIFGRFLVDAWLRQHTIYALTDRRVLIARSGPWPSFRAVSLDRLPEASLTESSNGRGTIRFGPSASVLGSMNGTNLGGAWIAALDSTPQFLGIDDAQRVFAAVQERSVGGTR